MLDFFVLDFEEHESFKYCVDGDYLYYHYMQDGFNDNVRNLNHFYALFRVGDAPTDHSRLYSHTSN